MNSGAAASTAAGAQDLTRVVADASPDVIFYLDGHCRIEYCNPAWDDFALKNRGAAVLRGRITGIELFSVIPQVLQPFFRELFDNCARTRNAAVFEYECSSESVFRTFQMRVIPRRQAPGFIVVNSLRVERAHSYDDIHTPDPTYEGDGGLIAMCAHCRRARRVAEPQHWDWVPDYIRDPRARVSHGICPICQAYYYEMLPRQLGSSRG